MPTGSILEQENILLHENKNSTAYHNWSGLYGQLNAFINK